MSAISRVNGSAVAATKDALASKLADAKAAEVKNTPQAMNDAAVASKEVVVKDVEKTIEVSNATTSAALKLDSVQISDEAKSANTNSSADKFNNAAASTKEAATAKTTATKEVVNSDSLQVTKEAVKTERAERVSKSRRTRASRSPKVSTASKADRASKSHNAHNADKAEKAHGTRHDRKVEETSKHVSATDKDGSTTSSFDDKANNNGSDATQAPRQSIFVKKDDAQAPLAPNKSIFDKMAKEIDYGLDSYKDANETTDARETAGEDGAKQANAEAELSTLV
jgi:hypothetical protein